MIDRGEPKGEGEEKGAKEEGCLWLMGKNALGRNINFG